MPGSLMPSPSAATSVTVSDPVEVEQSNAADLNATVQIAGSTGPVEVEQNTPAVSPSASRDSNKERLCPAL